MNALVVPLPGADLLADRIASVTGAERGRLDLHRFPDGEVRIRLAGVAAGSTVILVGSLDHPDGKILPLLFAADTARDLGAEAVGLVAPYLPYLRQDRAFEPGEGVSARHFARLLSGAVSWLVTVDPHLHRIPDLAHLFGCRTEVVHAAPLLGGWIRARVGHPLVIGPDEESRQWVRDVADAAGAPWTVLVKHRHGDRSVEVTLPPELRVLGREPVLVDDIVSSGATMAAALRLLEGAGFPPARCLVVHPVFAPRAVQLLRRAGALDVVSCNTLDHPTNGLDVGDRIATAVGRLLLPAGGPQRGPVVRLER